MGSKYSYATTWDLTPTQQMDIDFNLTKKSAIEYFKAICNHKLPKLSDFITILNMVSE